MDSVKDANYVVSELITKKPGADSTSVGCPNTALAPEKLKRREYLENISLSRQTVQPEYLAMA